MTSNMSLCPLGPTFAKNIVCATEFSHFGTDQCICHVK